MKHRKILPSAEELRALFSYDRESGIAVWKTRPSRAKIKVGDEVKSKFSSGYLRVTIKGSTYRLHLVIWKMETGVDPVDEVDHLDLDKTNNRWGNLREATRSQNGMNIAITTRNTSGFKGVSQVPCGKWKASIRHKGKLIYLGHHDTREGAHAAYVAKSIELFGEFTRAS